MRTRFSVVLLCLSTLGAVAPPVASAQEPRLVGRLPDAVRVQVDSVLDSAGAVGLPAEPLVDRALEGAAKGASGDLIVSAVRRLWDELRIAREAFGDKASPGELIAGASALRAGARQADLAQLRTLRPGQQLTVAAAVLADLVAVGVPADTAIAAVLALAPATGDAEYMAFRRNVERDIALGASPAAALGVRLQAVDDLAAEAGPRPTTPPQRRKP